MLKLSGAALAMVSLVQAMAVPNSPTTSSSPVATGLVQLAQFDNDPGVPGSAVDPINVYQDIYWQGMAIYETEASTVPDLPSLVPNSPPNRAAFSALNPVTIEQGTPEMTVVYADLTFTYFNLYSFFYGCTVVTPTSAVSVPASCNMTITGVSPSGTQVATQTFEFVANGLTQQMPQAVAKGFTGVQYVTFTFVAAVAGTAGGIDTVSYEIF